MNAIRSWEADLGRRLGIGGLIQFDKTSVAKTLHIPCAVGEHLVDFNVQANLDPNGTVKRMIHAGWTVGRKRLVCPDCKRKSEQAKADKRRELLNGSALSDEGTAVPLIESLAPPEPPKKNPVMVEAARRRALAATPEERTATARRLNEARWGKKQEEPKVVETQATATDKARAAKREAMDLLTLAFKLAPDGKSGTYQDGYSDARIAKETGLAEPAVATLREDFFGPLGEPEELVNLRLQLQEAHTVVCRAAQIACDAENKVKAIERRFDELSTKMGWPVA